MKQVNIRVTGKDNFLRDTTIGAVYTAERYDVGEELPHNPIYTVAGDDVPVYAFNDDVGDLVVVLACIPGQYIEEV